MPFAPTRNNRVAPRKRTLTSPIPTVKDGVARRRNPVAPAATSRVTARPNAATPLSTPSVKTGTVRPPRPQARVSAKTIQEYKGKLAKVEKQPFIGVKARPLKTKITKKKSR